MTAGAAIFGLEGTRLSLDERAFFREFDPLGFILFARNVDTPDQLRALTSELREVVGREAPILIDQEGGRVARMGAPHWREWLPPLDQAQQTHDPARAMYLRYRIIADELRAVGIDANCAPCADIAFPDTHPFLRNRCFAQTAEDVVPLAWAVTQGLLDGGVLPVLKHIPGHGRARSDSHKEIPYVDASEEMLMDTDFKVYKALNDLPLGMTAHVVYRGLGMDAPATTSGEMIALIRKKLGFRGLLMTDDISMNALSGTVSDRAKDAFRAGVDVVLHCNGNLSEMQQIAQVSGTLGQGANWRLENALAQRQPPIATDISALEAELQTLYIP